ncbi:MAG: SRPBCC domain-containing protein [Anaerolineales bacterium]|nr:SRPBCC domain-containing protein [Anaerolineales bacterium]
MKDEFTLTATFNSSADKIYKAWLSTQGHTLMTGSPAKVDGRVNGKFSAWDGYIWGEFLELNENEKIVQAWRTSEFPENAEDSHVEIILEGEIASLRQAQGTATGESRLTTTYKTKLILVHTNIPAGQAESYKTGWEDFYFKPMREYFG